MANNSQMTITNMGSGRTLGNGRGTVMGMNSWVDIQLTQARAQGESLAREARSERLARIARRQAGGGAPSLRIRFGAAVAAWKRPGNVSAA
jgi:hypothetical protein